MDKNKKKYSLPLYEDGKKTKYTIDFVEGDEKWKILMNIHNEIPLLINVRTKDAGNSL